MRGDWEYNVGNILAEIGEMMYLYVVTGRGNRAYYVRTMRVPGGKFVGVAVFDKYDVEDGPFIRVDDVGE